MVVLEPFGVRAAKYKDLYFDAFTYPTIPPKLFVRLEFLFPN